MITALHFVPTGISVGRMHLLPVVEAGKKWILKLGWEALVNKRSSSWRALDNRTKDRLSNDNIVSVLIEKPTLIKRPVVTYQNQLVIGFKEGQFAALLNQLK